MLAQGQATVAVVITRDGRLSLISVNKHLPISSLVLIGASISQLELQAKLNTLASGNVGTRRS